MSNVVSAAKEAQSSLLARVKKHEADAWLRLVTWIGPFILRWCHGAGVQSGDCDGLAAKVLEDVWRDLAAFRREKPDQSFRRWLHAKTIRRIELLAPELVGSLPAADADGTASTNPSETHDWTRRALHLVVRDLMAQHAHDPGFKAFFRLALIGRSPTEVAQELGLKVWGVRQARVRWTKRVRDRLHELFGELLD